MQIPGYAIQREIGKGGMATVYLAIQESLDRAVVLKMLDDVNVDNSEDLAERFIAEGRILASLVHPNIITIYDIGVANNQLYISMEYVQGGDLKQRLELPISPDEALDYVIKVANALSEAHKHGIVHRDVKPANILFKDNDTPLLTDFGIAKQVGTDSDLTSTGIFLGSPNYVSPEQADGIKIDGRADIYSLGCIFYEMLMGEKPYKSNSVIEIVIQHKQAPVPTLPEELKEFQAALNKMMAKKRDERFHDAESLVIELEKLQRKRNKRSTLPDFDITGAADQQKAVPVDNKRAKQILVGLLLLGLVMFSSLKYVEIKIKDDSPIKTNKITTNTVLDKNPVVIPTTNTQVEVTPQTGSANQATTPVKSEPAPEQVIKALLWLGKQSLEEYKLTYPPRDNAYYYFNRLLELQPGNEIAISGIYEISDRYSILAEQSLAKNEFEKMTTYVDIGLRINPNNEALLALKNFAANQDNSLLATIKSLFN